mmetsp:Transcript_8289/g.8445  ORF Transcript_8289/g.8445 Transcript_8289/m.8445 type:complete len:177 (+) Transcript_8289:276-806(+)
MSSLPVPFLLLLLWHNVMQKNTIYQKSKTGIEYYDYTIGDGKTPSMGDKISFHYKGRLAGRQGWIYDDTRVSDNGEPVRIKLGSTPCVRGVEIGIVGDGEEMPAMRAGGKRRLVIPSKLGYTDRIQLPIPSDFGQQQRLYSTVLNPVRGEREKEALGDSLTGILVLDIDLLRVKKY